MRIAARTTTALPDLRLRDLHRRPHHRRGAEAEVIRRRVWARSGLGITNKVRRGDIRHAVVRAKDGSLIRFDDNACSSTRLEIRSGRD
jgi:ribosomal protein L14